MQPQNPSAENLIRHENETAFGDGNQLDFRQSDLPRERIVEQLTKTAFDRAAPGHEIDSSDFDRNRVEFDDRKEFGERVTAISGDFAPSPEMTESQYASVISLGIVQGLRQSRLDKAA